MGINLKKHNQEAYKKVKDMLKEENKAAVVHPTGTGKTYIALKWIEEAKVKKEKVEEARQLESMYEQQLENKRQEEGSSFGDESEGK